MKLFILLFLIDDIDRTEIDLISPKYVEGSKELQELLDKAKLYYPISDFIDACNNQEIDLDSFWLSHIYIEEKP